MKCITVSGQVIVVCKYDLVKPYLILFQNKGDNNKNDHDGSIITVILVIIIRTMIFDN